MSEIKQICTPEECDNEPLMDIKIGSVNWNFCCLKGFQKSLDEFAEYMNSGGSAVGTPEPDLIEPDDLPTLESVAKRSNKGHELTALEELIWMSQPFHESGIARFKKKLAAVLNEKELRIVQLEEALAGFMHRRDLGQSWGKSTYDHFEEVLNG